MPYRALLLCLSFLCLQAGPPQFQKVGKGPGVLLIHGFGGSRFQCFKFCFDGRNVGVDQVIKQTDLIRAQLLAALGKLEALELRNLVGQLFDKRLVAVDLLAHCLDFLIETLDTLHQLRRQSAQLFRGQLV